MCSGVTVLVASEHQFRRYWQAKLAGDPEVLSPTLSPLVAYWSICVEKLRNNRRLQFVVFEALADLRVVGQLSQCARSKLSRGHKRASAESLRIVSQPSRAHVHGEIRSLDSRARL